MQEEQDSRQVEEREYLIAETDLELAKKQALKIIGKGLSLGELQITDIPQSNPDHFRFEAKTTDGASEFQINLSRFKNTWFCSTVRVIVDPKANPEREENCWFTFLYTAMDASFMGLSRSCPETNEDTFDLNNVIMCPSKMVSCCCM